MQDEIELVRKVRRWRDLVGVPAAAVLEGRIDGEASEFVPRLARLRPTEREDEPIAAIGRVQILASEEIDAGQAAARIEGERERLRGEIERLERKLGNEGFVAKAPPAVVEDDRAKLAGYSAELDELG